MGIRMISGSDVTGGASAAQYAIENDNCQAVRVSVKGADARIAVGNSSVSVTNTTGMLFQSGMTDLLRLKSTDTHIAYIGSSATINIVECE